MNLKYKASNIAKAEREDGKKFFDVFTELGSGMPSFDSMLFMLRAGGMTEEEADKLIADEGIGETLIVAVEALTDAGFLGKTEIDTKAMRDQMKTAQGDSSSGGEVKSL